MKFIVIEGLDGSGKTTQLNMVEDYLNQQNIKSKFLHFPRPETPFFGEMISKFLRGDLGPIDKVDPYLVAMLYAGDRNDAAKMIRKWLSEGYAVIADRYLYSNIGFQCAKVADVSEREKLAKWIKELEYNYYDIPMPDLNLFLKVPFEFTQSSLQNKRVGSDRDYLKGSDDIHEADLDFQKMVREVYLSQVKSNSDFVAIDCIADGGGMLNPEDVFQKIKTRINEILK